MSKDKAKLNDSAEGRAFVEQVRQREAVETVYEALGVRALACKGWRWREGMLGLSVKSSSRSIWIRVVDPPNDDTNECWPDFRDPATLGCLLALVREAWNDPTLGVSAARGGRSGRPAGCWHFHGRKPHRRGFGRRFTGDFFFAEASALVAALEAAP